MKLNHKIFESEGQLIKYALGEQWSALSAKTQARFETDPTHEAEKEYTGVMSEVDCSLAGKIFAYCTGFLGAPLIPYKEQNVPIHVRVYKRQGNAAIYKQRTYFFKNHPAFTVQSHMVLAPNGEFQEYSSYGLGMRIELAAKEGGLYFYGRGYFLKVWKFIIPIPLVLSPGHVIITHHDYEEDAFRVRIEMRHPWFGKMFVQDGIFRDYDSTHAIHNICTR
jgi:hypothetical protein